MGVQKCIVYCGEGVVMENWPNDIMNQTDSPGDQREIIGVVIEVPDPKKNPELVGRFKIRFPDSHDLGKVPDDKCPWVPTSHFLSPNRGFGLSWPSMYKVGQKVICANDGGQQGYHIVRAIANQLTDDTTADTSPVSRGKQQQTHNAAGNFADDKKFSGKPWDDLIPKTQTGLNIVNEVIKTITNSGNPLEAIAKTAPIPDKYGRRLIAKSPDQTLKSIGTQMFSGELLNLQKYMQQVGSQEMIPNALNILQTLKDTAKSGSNITAIDSVGGLSNITGALSGIASSVSSEQNRNNSEDEADLLEQLLRALYIALTKKQPLDEFGNETVHYQKWKANYLQGIIDVIS